MKKTLVFSLKFISSIGVSTALPLVILGLIGRNLDRKYDTSPKLFLLFITVATIITFFILRKIVTDAIKEIKEINKNNNSTK